MQHYQERDPQRVAALRDQVATYKRKLAWLNLRDNMLKDGATPAAIWRETAKLAALSLAGLPLAAYGNINNFIPYLIAKHLPKSFSTSARK
ncbi:hypothetical protein L0337_06090 [candidate division KSB1 bacterium]|nr:hypothetical protein [candidate division KSB1 bacterium]